MRSIVFLFIFLPLLTSGQQLRNDRVLLRNEGMEHAYPRLSADGKQILFQSNLTGKWQLYMLEITSDKLTCITQDSFNNNFPDWSSDGKYIAFVSDRNGNEEIYLLTTTDKRLQRITNHPARDIHPYFSPDGKYLLFNSTRGNGSLDIFRYDLQLKKTERITTTTDHETCARYNADMSHMVFLRNNDRTDDIFLKRSDNGLDVNLTQTPDYMDGWPMFSPKGDWIYFSSAESGRHSIYRIRTDGSEKTQITFPSEGQEDARIFVGLDDRTIVNNRREGNTIEIRMAELL